jgi:hypothetical protein
MNLNGILIGSEDPEGLVAYYTRLFGEPGWARGDFRGWQLGTDYVTVGPHDQVRGRNPQPGRLIWNLETPTSTVSSNGSRPPAPRWSRSPTSRVRRPRAGSPRSRTRTTTTSSSSAQ